MEVARATQRPIERLFYRWADVVYRYPYFIAICIVFIVAGFATQLPKVTFDTSTEGFLKKSNPALVTYNRFRDIFGRDERIVVTVEADNLFSFEALNHVRSLHKSIEETLPHLDEVTSLLNARHIYGDHDDLIVEDLLEDWPKTQADLDALEKTINDTPLYKGLLVSEDKHLTTLLIKLNTYTRKAVHPDRPEELTLEPLGNIEFSEVAETLRDIIQQHRGNGLDIQMAGSPMIITELQRLMLKDIRLFASLTFSMIALVLLILFRRLSGVVLPLITVFISIATAISIMVINDQPLQLPTAVLPSFLVSVGIGDSVHFLSLFYRRFSETNNKYEALQFSLGHSGLPMLLTSLTTAAGLLSFSGVDILPIANLGIYASAGVMIAFIYTITFLPAMICIVPLKPRARETQHLISKDHNKGPLNRAISYSIYLATNHSLKVIVVSMVVTALALYSALQLDFSHNPMRWIPDNSSIKSATKVLDEKVGGSVNVEILIDTSTENGVYNPLFLQQLDQLEDDLAHYENEHFKVGHVMSVTDIIKETNRALHGNQEDHYTIPDNRELIAQELFLLEMSGADDLQDRVSEYRVSRTTVSIPWIDTLFYKGFIDELESLIKSYITQPIQITVTGMVPLLGKTLTAVIRATAESYAIAIGVISLMMILMLRSLKYGLISMIPNITPLVVVLGTMHLAGVHLDMFTMLIVSITIGLCVDDTIHFMHHFRSYYAETGNVNQSITLTLDTAGRAMVVTSVVLTAGFIIFVFSAMNNLTDFGIFTAMSIMLALLADFILAPALMVLFHRKDSAA